MGVGVGTHVRDVAGVRMPAMVDITAKLATVRVAIATSRVTFPEPVARLIRTDVGTASSSDATADSKPAAEYQTKKGPVFATATVAATMAVKNTAQFIPFCHPIAVERCNISFSLDRDRCGYVDITCEVGTTNKTGVEMEALTGASVAALTVYDMLKGLEGAQPGLTIGPTALLLKTGGKSDIRRSS